MEGREENCLGLRKREWKNEKNGGKENKKQSVFCDLLCVPYAAGTVRMGWWCPRSRVPLTGPLAGWRRAGGDTNPLCQGFQRLRRALGQGWCLEWPQNASSRAPPWGLSGTGVPKAVAVPLGPQHPAMHPSPHPAAPQNLGVGVSLPGGAVGVHNHPSHPPGVRQTHSKGDPRAKDADRARLFSLAAFCCCIHGNTITRDIYIIYILLKLHNQCTKTRVHC